MALFASSQAKSDSLASAILDDRLNPHPAQNGLTAEAAIHIAPVLVMPLHELTLFATQPPPRRGVPSFLGSILIHAIAAAVVWFSLGYKPPVVRIVHEHYAVRQIDLRAPEERQARAANQIPYPGLHLQTHKAAPSQTAAPLPVPTTTAESGPQTLIQADLLHPLTLPKKIPVPQVALWSPSKTTAKDIVPPLPEKPTASDVHPVIDRPNQEINLADVSVTASNLPSAKLQLSPGTTSPIAVHAPSQVQLPPVSASQRAALPTPTSVISLSELQLKDGSAVLPPVSESLPSNSSEALTAVQSLNPFAQPANGAHSASKSTGQNTTAATRQPIPSPAPASTQVVPASQSGSGIADNPLGRLTTTNIELPKSGQFGAVVVGDDLSQEFPEIENVWGGRVAYTAYLHVGLSRSWILQYSLPREAAASAGGTVSRLEAPWPYNIVRPNLPPDAIDADALMIRGFVDESGRFVNLSVAFPQPFAGSQFVLAAMQQWRFRPAMQHGRPTRVEVLLIVPEQLE